MGACFTKTKNKKHPLENKLPLFSLKLLSILKTFWLSQIISLHQNQQYSKGPLLYVLLVLVQTVLI